MEILLAWILPPITIALLLYVLGKGGSIISRLLASYVCFAVIFGCIHFLLYRSNPSAYSVSRDFPTTEAVTSIKDNEEKIKDILTKLNILDSALLRVEEAGPQKNDFAFDWKGENNYIINGVNFETRMRISFVGPRRDEPANHEFLTVTLTAPYRGVPAGSTDTYYLGSPTEPTLKLGWPELKEALLQHRKGSIDQLTGYYKKDLWTQRFSISSTFFILRLALRGSARLSQMQPRSDC